MMHVQILYCAQRALGAQSATLAVVVLQSSFFVVVCVVSGTTTTTIIINNTNFPTPPLLSYYLQYFVSLSMLLRSS